MAEFLDIAQPIIELDVATNEFKATPYFEDYLYSLVTAVGGEGSDTINNIISSSVQSDKVPYLFGQVDKLNRQNALFNTIIKTTNYTAKNRDFVEARNRITVKFPKNARRGDEIIVANGDGSKITIDGNGNNIKYDSTDSTFTTSRNGSSFHFHFFIDNDNSENYWRIR